MESSPPYQPITPASLHKRFPSLFFAFRLVYIPASILSHTGHGLPWLTAAAALLATFGTEALVRHSKQAAHASTTGRAVSSIIAALLLLGFFVDEAPIGVLLWATIGAAWARAGQSTIVPVTTTGLLLGALLGLSGLFGPGSWLMALLLALGWWRRHG